MQHKFCPLIRGECYESLCALYTGEKCSFSSMATIPTEIAALTDKLDCIDDRLERLNKHLDFIGDHI